MPVTENLADLGFFAFVPCPGQFVLNSDGIRCVSPFVFYFQGGEIRVALMNDQPERWKVSPPETRCYPPLRVAHFSACFNLPRPLVWLIYLLLSSLALLSVLRLVACSAPCDTPS